LRRRFGGCTIITIAEGQTRHLYLVFLAYSALMRQLQHDRAQEWAHARLTTIGESCRAMFRETLGKTIAWLSSKSHRARVGDNATLRS